MDTKELASELGVGQAQVVEIAAQLAPAFDPDHITIDDDGTEFWTGSTLDAEHADAVRRFIRG